MPRVKTGNKHQRILDAAAELIGRSGIGTSIQDIARLSGIANGTVLLYFPRKDVLLETLYLQIRCAIASAMEESSLGEASFDDRLHAYWTAYMDWALAHPMPYRALSHLTHVAAHAAWASGLLPREDRAFWAALDDHGPACAFPPGYADALFQSLADTTIDLVLRNPGMDAAYRAGGREALRRIFGGR